MNKPYGISNYAETKKHIFFNYRQGEKNYSVILYLETKSVKIAYIFNDFVYNGKGKNIIMVLPNYVFSTSEGVYDCMDINNQFRFNFIESIKNGDISIRFG
jgi:hypothetical protein